MDSSSVCSQPSISCVPKFDRNLTVAVRNLSVTSSTITITISGYQSPTTNSSSYFNLTTFDSSGNPIDTVDIANANTQSLFKPTCQLGCMTCSETNSSACTSCYGLSLDTRIYLNTYTQSCVDVCQIGYYPTSTKVCVRCGDGCTACNSSECINCSAGFSLYNMGCVNVCP